MRTKNILYLLLLIGFVSCEYNKTDLLPNDRNYQAKINPRIVVSAILHAESDSNFIFLSDNYPAFGDTLPKFTPLKTAQTVLYKNGIPDTDIRFCPGKGAWYMNDFFRAGDNVKIEVTDKNRKVSASAIIPEKPVILGVDTECVALNYYNMRFIIKIKAQPGKKNYYCMYLNREQTIHYNPDSVQSEYEIRNHKIPFDSDNRMGQVFYNSDFDPEFPYYYGYNEIIFNDDGFQNGEGTLFLYSNGDLRLPEHALEVKQRLTVKLQALSEDFYLFYSQMGSGNTYPFGYINNGLGYIFLNEYPTKQIGNIQGGLGIFGAVNETEYIVSEKTWKSQE